MNYKSWITILVIWAVYGAINSVRYIIKEDALMSCLYGLFTGMTLICVIWEYIERDKV